MAEGKSWYSTGLNNAAQDRKSDFTTYGPDRIWIPAGKSRELIFIDSQAFTFDEHNAFINGSWKNWMTCSAPITEEGEPECCRILGTKEGRYRVTMFTVIDCDKWTDKKGNVRQYEVKVLPAKFNTAQKLHRKAEELAKDNKTLVGRLYKVTRETAKSPSVGDEYEYVRDVDMSKLFSVATYKGKKLTELWDKADESADVFTKLARVFNVAKGADGKVNRMLVPFRYDSVFAPKMNSEIKSMLAGYKRKESTSADEGDSGSNADEEVPF